MIAPTISTAFDVEDDTWVLTATSYHRTAPAGERLFRGPPIPAIQFRHPDKASALRAVEVLQAYIDEKWKKGPSKAKVRKQGE